MYTNPHIKEVSLIPPSTPILTYNYKQRVPHLQHVHKVCDGVFISQLSNVSLPDYAVVHSKSCKAVHHQPCLHCQLLLKVADIALKEGACPLHQAFVLTSPCIAYDKEKAKRRLLEMHLGAIRIGKPSNPVRLVSLC